MSVNGVTSTQAAAAYSYSSTESVKPETTTTESAKAESAKTEASSSAENQGVVYEPSKEASTASTQKTYKPDTNLISKLQADADARTQQMRSLVEKMMLGQSNAYGKANDIWSFLRKGDYTVDAATKMQAQADIAEDGYWGVEKTSDRIIDFANALTGGDPDKIEEMRAAFEKGFKRAAKTWGGDLPDISQRTYDAVMKKFDNMAAEAKKNTTAAKTESNNNNNSDNNNANNTNNAEEIFK